MNQRGSTSGFTLIEVLVALTITGVVALLAHRLASVTVDSARLLGASRAVQDRRENARRWLRTAFISLEAGGSAGGFEGHVDRVSFTSWQQQPDGWALAERLTIQLGRGQVLVARPSGEPVVLADSAVALAFDYLLEPGANTRWVREWHSPLSAPLAVRLRLTRRENGMERADTLLLLIKERG